MRGVAAHPGQRHLVGAERPLDLETVHDLRAGPALGRAQHHHRPPRPCGETVRACLELDLADVGDDPIERRGHQLVHGRRLIPGDKVRLVAVTVQQLLQLLVRHARGQRGVGDLVAVQVQDRQHGAVAHRVQELITVPARGERTSLGLAVADDAGDQEVGIVERCAVGVTQRVAELTTLVNGAGRLGRGVTRDAAGKGELPEQAAHTLFVLADLGVDLAVGPLEVGVGHHGRPAVPGPAHVDHVEIVLADDAVEVHVDEVLAGRRAPVTQQARLDVGCLQRLAQQRVGVEIDLADRQVIGRAPVRVHASQHLGRQGTVHCRLLNKEAGH